MISFCSPNIVYWDVSGYAVRRLLSGNICPIVIFIKPRDVKWVM